MCRAGIEYSYREVRQPSRGFSRGVIRKAKQRDLRISQRLLARDGILAQCFRNNNDFEIIAAGKPIANP
jgi:hypothetical protein